MWEQLLALGPLDWFTTITALIYVGLAARNNPWCWGFGAVACGTWGYLDIVQYQLYSDAFLQGFYVIMSGVGLYQWRFGGKAGDTLPISRMKWKDHLVILLVGGLTGWVLGYFVGANLPAAATYWDAQTTTFSIAATFLLLRRKLENWLYWIVIDVVYIGIYWSREAWLLSAIMLVYVIVAFYGYRRWRSEMTAI